ncbi:hypothetical protein PCH70_09920 [Pseudomonas cichorii JBC1]|nr:hypothetical protein PCH70_09920 [Pseudomonas cichorii JBC1]
MRKKLRSGAQLLAHFQEISPMKSPQGHEQIMHSIDLYSYFSDWHKA